MRTDKPPSKFPTEHRAHWCWPLGLAVVVFLASGQSAVASPGFINQDKVAHLSVFGLLGILITRTQPRRRWWLGFVLASVYGGADEWRQSFTPGRFVEFGDWLADTVGAGLAVFLYSRWEGFRVTLERKISFWPTRSVANLRGNDSA